MTTRRLFTKQFTALACQLKIMSSTAAMT